MKLRQQVNDAHKHLPTVEYYLLTHIHTHTRSNNERIYIYLSIRGCNTCWNVALSSLFWPLTWPRPDIAFCAQVTGVVFFFTITQDVPASSEGMYRWKLKEIVDKSRYYAATHGPHPVHLEWKATTIVSTMKRQKWNEIASKRLPIITQWSFISLRIKAGPKERAGLMPHPVKLIWKQQIYFVKQLIYQWNPCQ